MKRGEAGGTDVLAAVEARREMTAERAALADLAGRVSRLETILARLMFHVAERDGAGRSEVKRDAA